MTGQELAALLAERGLLTAREAIERVAGETIRGSWWGHPRSHAIYRELGVLGGAPGVLCLKLVEGKATFVHRRLWPALARVQRERSLWPEISAEAKRVIGEVCLEGPSTAPRELRHELERALLAIGVEEHTESGAHRAVLVCFDAWVPPDVARAADALALDQALAELAAAGFRPPARAAGSRASRRRSAPGSAPRSRRPRPG